MELINKVLDEYERLFIHSPEFGDEKPKLELKRDLECGSSELMVYGEDPVKGFCVFYKESYDQYFIDYLGVNTDHQGQGMGKRIMQSVLQHCFADSDIVSVCLLCVNDKIPFYERLGFIVVEKIENTIWNKMINKKCQH